MSRNQILKRMAKPMAFLLCFAPLAFLTWNFFTGNLSFNPIEDITHTTGRWALRFLIATVAVSPVRRITGFKELIRFRRMLGLFAFFYGTVHFTIYIWLDHLFDFATILLDIPERPFITAGFTAFILMVPLALTSTRKWISRLGGLRWQLLHRLIYVSAIAGVLHYLWNAKLVELGPVTYMGILAILLGFRLLSRFRPELAARMEFKKARRPSPDPI